MIFGFRVPAKLGRSWFRWVQGSRQIGSKWVPVGSGSVPKKWVPGSDQNFFVPTPDLKTKFKTTKNTLAGFLRWWNRIDNQSYSFEFLSLSCISLDDHSATSPKCKSHIPGTGLKLIFNFLSAELRWKLFNILTLVSYRTVALLPNLAFQIIIVFLYR